LLFSGSSARTALHATGQAERASGARIVALVAVGPPAVVRRASFLGQKVRVKRAVRPEALRMHGCYRILLEHAERAPVRSELARDELDGLVLVPAAAQRLDPFDATLAARMSLAEPTTALVPSGRIMDGVGATRILWHAC